MFKQGFFLFSLGFILNACSLFNSAVSVEIEADFSLAQRFSNEILIEDLKHNLTILSSDSLEGRETTKPGQKKAADFIRNYFIANNIPPATENYFQKFNVQVSDFTRTSLIIGFDTLSLMSDYFLFGSTKDTAFNNAGIINVDYGIVDGDYNNYFNKDVKNKIVVINEGVPPNVSVSPKWESWRKKQKLATQMGALAVITVKKDFQKSVDRISPFLLYPEMKMHKEQVLSSGLIPNFCISKNTFNKYLAANDSALTASFSVDINYKASSENVLGYIEGGEFKDELLVISAHYDHIGFDNGEVCNGADDDGSGTVSLMAIAKAFIKAKQNGFTPKRSVLFLSVSGEEKGLFGSRYYTENPIFPLSNTVANLNIDMIGRKDTIHQNSNYIYLIGSDKISQELHQINEKVNTKYIGMELDYTYNEDNDPNRFYYRSDHYNFAKNNIPVIFYFSGIHRDYHKPTDDVEKINFNKLHLTTKYVFFTAWEILNREKRIK